MSNNTCYIFIYYSFSNHSILCKPIFLLPERSSWIILLRICLNVLLDFGVHLAEFTIDTNGNLPVRQLASVLLKQYVENHWCNGADKFSSPEASERAKARIKLLIPEGLKETESKVIIVL